MRRTRAMLVLAVGLITPSPLVISAQEPEAPGLHLEASAGPVYNDSNPAPVSGSLLLGGTYQAENFGAIAELLMRNDGKYEAELMSIPGGKFYDNYILMNQGGVWTKQGDLSFRAGRLKHYDEVDSPYTVFINSLGHSANIMEIRFENEAVIYQSRWVELNHRSSYQSPTDSPAWSSTDGYTGFPERGANIKTYALKLGTMRLGFQDGAVYTGDVGSNRSFDLEYFVNPLPQYFIQYSKGTPGRPWTTGDNENNFIGLFFDWHRTNGSYWYIQTLLDDFSINAIAPTTPDYPYKAAWALGGTWETPIGTIGLHNSGSPMYSFEPITTWTTEAQDQTAYGYTYYPETRYTINGTTIRPITIEDNMIGYKYGENTLAFQGEWSRSLEALTLDLAAQLEYRVAGSASPANPWHDGQGHPLGTRMLDEAVLEHRVLGSIQGRKELDKKGLFSVNATVDIGFIWNERSLRAPQNTSATWSDVDRFVYIWSPVAGANRPLIAASLLVEFRN